MNNLLGKEYAPVDLVIRLSDGAVVRPSLQKSTRFSTKSTDEKQLIQPIIPHPSQPSIWEDRPQYPQQPNITINLVVPPEAIRVVVEQQAQPAPIVNVNVPDIVFPEIKFPEIPAPIVNIEVPRQQRPVVNIEIPEQPAPIVNVETQPVNVNVRVPKQPAPIVNVEAPQVNV